MTFRNPASGSIPIIKYHKSVALTLRPAQNIRGFFARAGCARSYMQSRS